ncbi:M28 family peptidase [Parasphingorhabdus sp. DH2-15]|uniref:M28 family peptidase n=1 Tax=Parasphingorhabdus sp. DH2-15 TaxID=3444112 RepID=UPI003F68795E
MINLHNSRSLSFHSRFALLAAIGLCTSIAHAQDGKPTTEEDVREHIAILASDDFAGRNPGTIGETKTLNYLAQQWSASGMVSGTNDPKNPWFQPVPLMQRTTSAATARFTRSGRKIKVDPTGILLSGQETNSAVSGEVIFVGYGVDAVENEAADVEGKIALMLFGSPEGAEDFPSRQERVEALAEAGASAVLTIAPSQFPWGAIRNQVSRGSYGRDTGGDAPMISGLVNADFVAALFKGSGSTLAKETEKSNEEGYTAFVMGVAADLTAVMQIRKFNSYNVIGKFPGKKPGSGAVLFLGHWDHFGTCRPVEAEDRICNGALDNASGMAVLTEVAEELGAMGPFDRDIYFMGTTAEERGLLGAYHFADNPPFPLKDIVIALNIDTIAIAERGAPVAIIGRGETDLDATIDSVSESIGRKVETSLDSNAFIQRQDGWALAAKGVPAFMVGGSFADLELLQSYLSGDYHGPGDELKEGFVLGGAAEDTDLHIALAEYFANEATYPGK